MFFRSANDEKPVVMSGAGFGFEFAGKSDFHEWDTGMPTLRKMDDIDSVSAIQMEDISHQTQATSDKLYLSLPAE